MKDSKPKTLKQLQKELPATEDIHRMLAELQLAPDYPAAMVSGSLMEAMLRYLLTAHMIPMGGDHTDNIFGDQRGVLRTFSSKIDMSYALSLIGPETRAALDIIRIVRNHFAHYAKHTTFNSPEIKLECDKLRMPADLKKVKERIPEVKVLTPEQPPKLKYVQTCFAISLPIHNHIAFIGKETAPRFPVPINSPLDPTISMTYDAHEGPKC